MTLAGVLLRDLRIVNDEEAYARIEAELAAAEERGRRRGVEEAAKRADRWYVNQDSEWTTPGEAIRRDCELALRDSAPACDCGVRLGSHASFCATRQPQATTKAEP